MKHSLVVVAIFFSLFTSYSIQAQPYVWARSGLILRDTPDFTGNKILTAPYGTPVKVFGYANAQHFSNELGCEWTEPEIVSLEVIKADAGGIYALFGSWVKVEVLGKTGYMFDGYLSNMRPNTTDHPPTNGRLGEGFEALRAYGARTWGTAEEKVTTPLVFKNGNFNNQDTEKWVIPEITEKDGFLLFNYFLGLEQRAAGNPKKFKFEGKSNGALDFWVEEVYSIDNGGIFYIRVYDNTLILSFDWETTC